MVGRRRTRTPSARPLHPWAASTSSMASLFGSIPTLSIHAWNSRSTRGDIGGGCRQGDESLELSNVGAWGLHACTPMPGSTCKASWAAWGTG